MTFYSRLETRTADGVDVYMNINRSLILFTGLLLLGLLLLGCESRSPEKLRILVAELRSSDPEERNAAALSIGRYGPDGKAAVPELVRVLTSDKSRGIRTSAAYALRQINTPEAIRAIEEYRE